MGKENVDIGIREKSEFEIKKADNIKFWNECGVKPLFNELSDKALDRRNKNGDVICDLMENETSESMSLVINWYYVEGRYSTVSVSRREEKGVYFLTRENGEKKEGIKFDTSKPEEKKEMLNKINSVFLQYLIPPFEK